MWLILFGLENKLFLDSWSTTSSPELPNQSRLVFGSSTKKLNRKQGVYV